MGFPKPSTASPMPIPPKPPWYSTPTAIVSLPTAVPTSCNSLIESPTDTPATENRTNKSYDNIENNNDRPDDDDDVDCFPRQDKQPVLPQDISPTDTPRPSLIESTTDTPTAPMNFENNNNMRRATHQHEQNDPHTEKQKQSQHIPLSQQHPSLYGMAHSINSITTMTTVQFLLGMEPHTLTLCMMMMMIITVQMITHTVTPSI